MPYFDNQRRCVQGKENHNSILLGYSGSVELVLCKYAPIPSVRSTMASLKLGTPLVPRWVVVSQSLNCRSVCARQIC